MATDPSLSLMPWFRADPHVQVTRLMVDVFLLLTPMAFTSEMCVR